MPMCRRSSRNSEPPGGSGLPSNTIEPSSTVSRPLIQRSSVVLPDPERPMTATTSPASTSSDTSLRTRCEPKCLRMLLNAKSGIDPPFEPQRDQRNRPTQHEVEYGNQRIDHHRLEGDVDDELSGAGQFYEADDRRDRGALDQLHQETYGRWNRDAKGLRQNHMTQLRSGRKRNRRRRLPLLPRDGLNRAAPDLAQERGCIHRECQRDRRPRIDANAGKHREAVVREEQLHQYGRSLHHADVGGREPAQDRVRRRARDGEHETTEAATDKGNQRQHHGPAQGAKQEQE